MSTIVTRAGKGSALTHNEVDANFNNLNTDKIEAAQTVTLTNKTLGSGTAITAGTINGATIGATTASTGAFTTLTTSSTVTHNGGTANGVMYLNGSKVATTGTALVFDGTNLGVGTNSPATSIEISRGASAAAGISFRGNNNTAANEFFVGQGGAGTAFIYQRANTDLYFGTNNLTRLTLDASGNLGLGVTPSAWGNNAKPLQAANACFWGISGNATFSSVGANYYYDATGVYKYISTAAATDYYQSSGQHGWRTAASGTAGNTITFTQAMTLDASGNLLVGTTTAANKLTVYRTSSSTTSGALMLDGNGNYAGVQFANSGTARGSISVDSSTMYVTHGSSIAFRTGGTGNVGGADRATIDSSSMTLSAIRILISGASGIPVPVNNGDGNMGTSATGGLNLIGKGSTYDISFLNKNGSYAGYVATGATTITTSSDERLKENLQPITGALNIVRQMRHETGNYKSDPTRTVAFLIAQDVDKLFPYAVEKANPDEWGINYNWITPLHGAAITELAALVQEQQAMIDELKAKVAQLESA